MKILAVILLIILFLIGLIMFRQPEYPISRGEQLVNSILANTAKITKNKFNVKPCGAGAAMPGGPIQELILCFDTKHPYTKEELRRLLIDLAHELLNQVTENEEIQQFLKEPPFTIKNVQIIIYNHDKKNRSVYDPWITTAKISTGILTYRTIHAIDTFKVKKELDESYEEALQALSNS